MPQPPIAFSTVNHTPLGGIVIFHNVRRAVGSRETVLALEGLCVLEYGKTRGLSGPRAA